MGKKSNSILNEETVKNRVILPMLKTMNFEPTEIEYEIGFEIRIGHSVLNIQKNQEERKRGYLDILCLKDKRPLFVIETKASNHNLTKEDREQAISYARLLMAPITVVTNGIKTLILDTISNDCLNDCTFANDKPLNPNELSLNNSSFVKNGYTISIDEELKYEALRKLVSYNFNNILTLSNSQVCHRMDSLMGSINDLTKKYIPELYIENNSVKKEFANFSKSEKFIFAIIGEQGIGKTNLLCHLALELVKNQPTLFYYCGFLSEGIFNAISDDFNWEFSSEKSQIQVIKRLDEILGSHGSQIYIFLDAIDEWEISNAERKLNDFVSRVNNKNFKLIITCKDHEWNRFLKISGVQTETFKNIYYPENNNLQISEEIPGVKLNKLTEQEHEDAINKYKNIFHFKGELKGNTFEESRLFFMLRAIAETYRNSNENIPSDLKSIRLIKKYLDSKLEKIEQPNIAFDIIRKIGNEIYNSNKNEVMENIITQKLKVDIHSMPYIQLISNNVFVARCDYFGNRYISFYFEKIRDYAVAFLSERWIELDEIKFYTKIEEILSKFFGGDVLKLYLKTAPVSHLNEILSFNKKILKKCLDIYKKKIDFDFPNLKQKFFPYSGNKMGMIYLANNKDNTIDGFGFREINDKHPEEISVLKIPFFDLVLEKESRSNKIFFEYGIENLKKNYSNITINPEIEAEESIIDKFSEIVKEGKLNESLNLGLAIEKTYQIIFDKGSNLRLGKREQDTSKEISSFTCDEVLERLEKFKLHEIAKEMTIERLKKEGRIKGEKRGTRTSYSYNYNDYGKDTEKLYEDFISERSPIPDVRISLPEEYFELKECIEIIRKNQSQIGDPLLPASDLRKPYYSLQLKVADYSDESVINLVKTYFKCVFVEYKTLVEVNLPKIKSKLPLYKSFPIHFFAEISSPPSNIWNSGEPDREINFTFIESDKDDFEIYIAPPKKRWERFSLSSLTAYSKKGSIKLNWIRSSLISNLLRGSWLNFRTPIRNFVYKILIKELNELDVIK